MEPIRPHQGPRRRCTQQQAKTHTRRRHTHARPVPMHVPSQLPKDGRLQREKRPREAAVQRNNHQQTADAQLRRDSVEAQHKQRHGKHRNEHHVQRAERACDLRNVGQHAADDGARVEDNDEVRRYRVAHDVLFNSKRRDVKEGRVQAEEREYASEDKEEVGRVGQGRLVEEAPFWAWAFGLPHDDVGQAQCYEDDKGDDEACVFEVDERDQAFDHDGVYDTINTSISGQLHVMDASSNKGGLDEPSKSTRRHNDAVCQGHFGREPCRRHCQTGHRKTTHSHTDTDALGEQQLPVFCREALRDGPQQYQKRSSANQRLKVSHVKGRSSNEAQKYHKETLDGANRRNLERAACAEDGRLIVRLVAAITRNDTWRWQTQQNRQHAIFDPEDALVYGSCIYPKC